MDVPQVVNAPPELVALVGAERLRLLHAGLLRKLKASRGGRVGVELEAKAGGIVVDGPWLTTRERE